MEFEELETVTPLAGVWIETVIINCEDTHFGVTPLAGVWIETAGQDTADAVNFVTPLAGVWIETRSPWRLRGRNTSLPLRECGLKLLFAAGFLLAVVVTPLAGVWIETQMFANLYLNELGHSPCGSVD